MPVPIEDNSGFAQMVNKSVLCADTHQTVMIVEADKALLVRRTLVEGHDSSLRPAVPCVCGGHIYLASDNNLHHEGKPKSQDDR